ncbi:uncharacterized protein L3040_009481 [Drepanopeziza brunnea f. sp. 'multigermtubi']|uniref:FAD dependent oxidoreductase domain-containing protein n=1 Tax=Marssonina brunnea f. sp. multigermtubi (strain MB_m1) TaxID=1072389 RepID=K1WV08_MARBU|nr:uncharacterized protein MBM_05581 [Drepanopeziza brunnea f. sp. 'multigermtubi' MB_m1]EKD16287.1 hypothetical protein MBM_05581 [Drepanopeziza brunnea f. sp. 'multigermtubi' MB_m1]KAJ5032890.1 hypothetical protein L3040_009481 [Drepanopeziza brunnea f. sp. 'multigermtubi']
MSSREILASASSLTTLDPGLPRAHPTQSFWQEPAHPLSSTQSPSLPARTEILILGSGITGCAIAKHLLENSSDDQSITILEARTLCSGATGRNGGHLTSSAPCDYLDLVAALGKEQALKVARFTLLNIEKVYALAKEVEGSEVRLVEGVMSCFDEEALEHARASVDEFERDAVECRGKYTSVDANELEEKYGVRGTLGGLVVPAGAIWPYRLVTSLYAQLVSRYPDRFCIETSTPATEISFDSDSGFYNVTTPRGNIQARHVLHATNGHAGHLLPLLRGKIYPLRGTMTVQRSPPTFPNIGSTRSWSTHARPTYDSTTGRCSLGLYYMTQNAKTGDIFLGGEEKPLGEILTSDDTTAGDGFAVQNLQDLPGAWFGEAVFPPEGKEERLRSSWSGIMGFTGDGLPLVGNLEEGLTGRKGGGEWIAAGFNGYGMVNCWMSGIAVANMVLGRGGDNKGWFPEAYLACEERLSERINVETAFQDLFPLKEK